MGSWHLCHLFGVAQFSPHVQTLLHFRHLRHDVRQDSENNLQGPLLILHSIRWIRTSLLHLP